MLTILVSTLLFQYVQPSDIYTQQDSDLIKRNDDPLLPYFPTIVENVTISHGRKAVLKCQVENLRNYKVAWVRVDTQTILTIHNNVISRNPRISLSRPGEKKWDLHINSVQESDRGWYMCQINTDPMVHRSGYLEVVVPPRITSEPISSLVVREGDNVSLECEATGYPPPHIVWRREDGEDINLYGKKVNIVERAVLKLDKISRLNMADYLCVASNGIPPSASNRFSVKVQFPPMFWIPSQREGVYLGQDVTIECHSEAYPKSINYWVNHKGAMLVSSEKYEAVTVDSGYKIYMKLHIRNITEDDLSEYRCIAKNSLGTSDGSITLYEIIRRTTPRTTTEQTTEYVFKSHFDKNRKPGHRRKKNRARHREAGGQSDEYHSYHIETLDRNENGGNPVGGKIYMEEQGRLHSNSDYSGIQHHRPNLPQDEEEPFFFGPRSGSGCHAVYTAPLYFSILMYAKIS